MIIYCIIITILFLLLSFLYLRLRSDVRTGERQIEYIQKEKSAMKLSLPDSLPALRHIVEMVEEQRDEVMQMQREQQRKDQEMKEMISCISHDIRTPLTSISGYIEMLSHAEEQDIPRYLQIISSRLNDMEEMLDSFFEYTRLQADQEALTLQRRPLYPLLCETLLSYYAQLHEQGLDPVLRCSAEDAAIMMDPDAMKRIFQNLIINTLRYGSAPFTIVIRQEKDRVHCTFSNHADPAQIDVSRIFQRFYQGDCARQRGGSGLGMAIVSELCAQMDIHIQARLEGGLLLIDMEMKAA